MSTVHVLPVGDLIEHADEGTDCPCGPTVEPVFADDGSCGWLITHHSIDGRESKEQVMKSVRRQLADRLYDHEWDDGACNCGWKPPPDAVSKIGGDHGDHVAAVLVNDFNIQLWGSDSPRGQAMTTPVPNVCANCGKEIQVDEEGPVIRYWTGRYEALCEDCCRGVSQ